MNPRVPKGLAFGRYVKAIAANRQESEAVAYAQGQAWDDTPQVHVALKAAVATMTTDSAAALAVLRPLANEFLELVRPRSLIDRIVGLRQVPPNVSVLQVTGGAVAWWVGEAAPKPIGKVGFGRATLHFDKLVALVVVTKELLMASQPTAEMALTQELARGVAAFGDAAFIDPALGPAVGVSPGSISYGVTPIASTGATLAQVQADLKALFANFVAVDGSLEDAVLVMHPRTALALSLLTGSAGAPAFPNIGARGGEIAGVPVLVTSAAMSGGNAFMVLLDPSQILIADDGDVRVSRSEHGAVQMTDSPAAGPTNLVSLFQTGCVGLLAERSITWKRASDAGVAVLTGVAY